MTLQHSFHGLEIGLRAFGGARAVRVVHPGAQVIAPHRHDWPLLTIPALGGYLEQDESGTTSVDGPAVILHPAGWNHANCIHAGGMETFSIEFDPAWLGEGFETAALARSHYWIGGRTSHAARDLARLWRSEASGEEQLRRATASFLSVAFRGEGTRPPSWLANARQRLATSPHFTAVDLARELDLHPRWVAQAYRLAAGEGLHETVRRKRVELAVRMLRESDEPIAEVAAAVGFCDQSHLNRALRALTGRTPVQVRDERNALRTLVPGCQACSGDLAPSPC